MKMRYFHLVAVFFIEVQFVRAWEHHLGVGREFIKMVSAEKVVLRNTHIPRASSRLNLCSKTPSEMLGNIREAALRLGSQSHFNSICGTSFLSRFSPLLYDLSL